MLDTIFAVLNPDGTIISIWSDHDSAQAHINKCNFIGAVRIECFIVNYPKE